MLGLKDHGPNPRMQTNIPIQHSIKYGLTFTQKFLQKYQHERNTMVHLICSIYIAFDIGIDLLRSRSLWVSETELNLQQFTLSSPITQV